MAYIAAVFELVKSMPAILGVLLELRKMWNDYLSAEDRRENMLKLQEAIKNARETRDTTQLTNLVNGIVTGQPDSSSK